VRIADLRLPIANLSFSAEQFTKLRMGSLLTFELDVWGRLREQTKGCADGTASFRGRPQSSVTTVTGSTVQSARWWLAAVTRLPANSHHDFTNLVAKSRAAILQISPKSKNPCLECLLLLTQL
jgi:hypothetical protein